MCCLTTDPKQRGYRGLEPLQHEPKSMPSLYKLIIAGVMIMIENRQRLHRAHTITYKKLASEGKGSSHKRGPWRQRQSNQRSGVEMWKP